MHGVKLSVVVPVYCSAQSLPGLYKRLCATLQNTAAEIIFVDDASGDESLQVLTAIAKQDSRVLVAALAKNQGQQTATFCGTALARGQYVAHLDDDGQNPPELLTQMLKKLQSEKLDIVYAVPQGVKHTGGRMRDALFRILFPNSKNVRVSAYRVITAPLAKKVVENRGKFNYFSATAFSLGAKGGYITYPYQPRENGRSGYSFFKRTALFLKILWYYGLFPKRRCTTPPQNPVMELINFEEAAYSGRL